MELLRKVGATVLASALLVWAVARRLGGVIQDRNLLHWRVSMHAIAHPTRRRPQIKRVALWTLLVLAVAVFVGALLVLWMRMGGSIDRVESEPSDRNSNMATTTQIETSAANVAAAAPPAVPPALWHPVDVDSVDANDIPPYKEVVKNRALVRLADGPRRWVVGERVSITIPQLGETYQPLIERVRDGPGDIRAYVGTLVERAGFRHSFVVTVGSRNTFANLSTPLGLYELVGNDKLGWLMPMVHMDQHVDYSKSDILPESVLREWQRSGQRGRLRPEVEPDQSPPH